jgi:hypothetical protein
MAEVLFQEKKKINESLLEPRFVYCKKMYLNFRSSPKVMDFLVVAVLIFGLASQRVTGKKFAFSFRFINPFLPVTSEHFYYVPFSDHKKLDP